MDATIKHILFLIFASIPKIVAKQIKKTQLRIWYTINKLIK